MTSEGNYKEINKTLWNDAVATHLSSDFYDMEGFLAGNSSLNPIELELFGEVKGKKILHLQCHFGQDTLSLARMGASVTGIDLSDKAIDAANQLAEQLEVDARFICTDVYSTPDELNEQFDIVFTSYGTIGWLPDLDAWAAVIRRVLKPGGRLVFVEFHPVVWMFDYDFQKVGYNYFNAGPVEEISDGTYADREADISNNSISWNHSLGEVMTALLGQGLRLDSFQEYDYSPYNCFRHTVEVEPKKFRIKHLDNKIPMLYALSATKA